MSVVFFAQAALRDFSRSSRTAVYAVDAQNHAPCLDKNYLLMITDVYNKTCFILREITSSNFFIRGIGSH